MRSLPPTPFAGDGGWADPEVDAALTAFAQDGRQAGVLVALSGSRLLVPVVALAGETEKSASGLVVDKTADIAAVLMQRGDGRKALLAFTSFVRLRAWNPEARPVPVTVTDAARSALADGADALLVDVAGPVMFAVEKADLEQLAAGRALVAMPPGHAWVGEA